MKYGVTGDVWLLIYGQIVFLIFLAKLHAMTITCIVVTFYESIFTS